ncbi:MAG: hypothetical protein LAN71_13110 [Acidobacteriia bacterium]|nr:hypothetical protein [Terriglobia bacterium]
MDLLKCLFLSFLPPRYRQSFDRQSLRTMLRAAFLSGLLQAIIFGELFLGGFVEYRKTAVIGYLAFLEYWVFPSTWLLALLWFDGVVRLLATFGGQSIGSIPLYFFSGMQTLWERMQRRARLGAKVADLVEPGDGTDYSLRISSCRPKPNWDHLMTVRIEEKLYEIAAQQSAAPPRPFVYLLRPKPENKVVRGLHTYSPEDVFSSED